MQITILEFKNEIEQLLRTFLADFYRDENQEVSEEEITREFAEYIGA